MSPSTTHIPPTLRFAAELPTRCISGRDTPSQTSSPKHVGPTATRASPRTARVSAPSAPDRRHPRCRLLDGQVQNVAVRSTADER
jgi:hypothetical protein